MNNSPESQFDSDEPAAYDAEGRPLYYRPSLETLPPQASAPQNIPTETQQKHDESAGLYPDLNLASSEFVVIDVERSLWGLVSIWAITCLAFVTFIVATVLISQIMQNHSEIMFVGFATATACFFGGLVATYVYNQNYFIVTNERVFARVQISPFSQRSQNVEIEHIEDCSYTQNGPLQMILGYGVIRLSTVGDEHTYQFTFVRSPAEQFKVINTVVRAVDEGESTKYP